MTQSVWTVFDRPPDYPGKVIARHFVVGPDGTTPSGSFIVAPDLEALRGILEFELHLTRFPRSQPGDYTKAIEDWLW